MTHRHASRYRNRRRSLTALGGACALALSIGAVGQPSPAAAASSVVNGGFDASTSGWFSNAGSSLTSAAGHSGAGSARVTDVQAGAATVALNDKVNTVASTTSGRTYTASAWVRLTRAGSKFGIRLMEYNGNTLKGLQISDLTATDTAWHQVRVSYTSVTSGATLDLNVLGWSLPSGAAIDVDDVTIAEPVTAAPAPSGWTQVWADEFDTATVNTAKWRVLNNEHHSNERSCLTSRPQNVSQSSGVLHIKAQREAYTCGGYTSAFTSGYLDTVSKMSQTYGRFEMRAKLPIQPNTSKGMWPAFWLRPNDGGNGEIDIMEAVGSAAGESNYNKFSQTLWYDYANTYPRQAFGVVESGTTLSDNFHTYAVEWEPTAIRWLYDGRVTFTRTTSNIWWVNSGSFNKPYNIRLNMQVGGNWPGLPNASTASTSDFQVDYVRVYKR